MYYTFGQNNSGGSFDFDESRGVTHYVIIEADNAEDANRRAEDLGIYFDGCESGMDCDCCGDRWSPAWRGDAEPSVYGSNPRNHTEFVSGWMKEGYEICVHNKDGTTEWYGAMR